MTNVILLSLDCVRPEAISYFPSTFDYLLTAPHQAKTPNIDAVAKEGFVFTNAFTQAPFTPASHASVFTGTNPYRHGIRGMFGYELRNDLTTMAEAFSDGGYKTGGFVGAHALSSNYGFSRGFETFDEEFENSYKNWIVGNRRPGEEVTSKGLDWMDKRDDDFFLFMHYFDAHDGGKQTSREPDVDVSAEDTDRSGQIPTHVRIYNKFFRSIDRNIGQLGERIYKSYQDLRDDSASGRRYHLKQVQKVDTEIGKIITRLKEVDEYDETIVVIFADHGDAFGEHGEYGHRDFLYDTTLRVPLIIKPPKKEDITPRISNDLVRLIDIYPTIAEFTNIEKNQSAGVNLMEHVEHGKNNLQSYAETRVEKSPSQLESPHTDYVSLRTKHWKLIVDMIQDKRELYNVGSDPEESCNLAESNQEVKKKMQDELEGLLRGTPSKIEDINTTSLNTSVVDQLEGLGYI